MSGTIRFGRGIKVDTGRGVGQKKKQVRREDEIYVQFARYMRACWPGVMYRFDFAAGTRLPIKLASFHKEIQESRAFPDLIIYEPTLLFHGFALEVKKEGVVVQWKKGTYNGAHAKEQADVLERFREKGWRAEFAIGITDLINKVEDYLYETAATPKCRRGKAQGGSSS